MFNSLFVNHDMVVSDRRTYWVTGPGVNAKYYTSTASKAAEMAAGIAGVPSKELSVYGMTSKGYALCWHEGEVA